MYVLGLNNGHNGTAVLLKDGLIVGGVNEERFTQIKNYYGIPRKSINYLLKKNHLLPKNLDLICLGYSMGGPLLDSSLERKNVSLKALPLKMVFWPAYKGRWFLWWLEKYFPGLRNVEEFLQRAYSRSFGRKTVHQEKEIIANFLKYPLEKIIGFDHHQAHAFCAYWSSPFRQKKVLALTLDAEGDLLCASVNLFDKNGSFKRIAATPVGHSLAQIYKSVTQYLGMKPNEHEYKVMGLAPYAKDYGRDKVYAKIKDWVVLDKKNPLVFKSKFHTWSTLSVLKKKMDGFRFDNLAAAFQKLVEDRVCEWVVAAIKETKVRTLVFGGGIFMNVKLNKKIAELKEVEEVFFMPSAGDESTSVGAAYLGHFELCRQKNLKREIKPIRDLYWGPGYKDKEIEKILQKTKVRRKYRIKKIKNIEKTIAKLLAQDKIVARLSGRMEWGARALGNRSILANPANPDLVRVLNEQIKNRDFWMPFTPSILASRATDYFVNPKNVAAPYMILAFDSTPLAQKDLQATMHPYDFTIRPQVVKKESDSRYYKIIKEFEKITGIGAVLNTSFNLHGLPIVLGPKEAVYVFENSDLEHLAMESYLISKKENLQGLSHFSKRKNQ